MKLFNYKNNYKKITLFLMIMFFLMFSFNATLAVGNLSDAFKVDNSSVYGDKDNLDSAAFNMGYNISLSGAQGISTPEGIIAMIIQTILSLVGVIFIILIIYGGFLWMTAGGNDQKIEKAKNILTRAIIGLAVVLLAYAISVFLVSFFVSPVSDLSSVDEGPYGPSFPAY